MTPLRIMEPECLTLFPDTPTAVGKGVDFTWSSRKGLVGPKNAPEADLKVLVDGLKAAVGDPEFRQKLEEMGEFAAYEDPAAYRARARKDSELAMAVIADLGMLNMNT